VNSARNRGGFPLFLFGLLLLLVPRSAAAQETWNRGWTFDPETSADNQRCTEVQAIISQGDDSIEFEGWAAVTTWNPTASGNGCNTDIVDAAPNSVVATYKLWMVDELNEGHTPTVCESATQWFYFLDDPTFWAATLQSPTIGGATDTNYTQGCGPGYYNLGVEGYALINGSWQGGTLFSGWQYMNVPAPRSILPPK